MQIATNSTQHVTTPNVGLDAVCLALRQQPLLAIVDLGPEQTLITWGSGQILTEQDDWMYAIRHTQHPTVDNASGWLGWLSYEAGHHFERMPKRVDLTNHPPGLCLWRYEGVMVYHHVEKTWSVCGESKFTQHAQSVLEQALQESRPALKPGQDTPHTEQQARDFQKRVKKALEHIQAGQVYQVNLAWEVEGLRVENPLFSYLQLRDKNAAARSAFIRTNDWDILSNSPELFLHTCMTPEGLKATSVPIKGTAPAAGPNAHQHLSDSPKERAELTMITDLVRNDLGRVSVPGTVTASKRQIRTCGDLLHAEQYVTGLIQPDLDSLDVVSACFPPGSVTGAPKVRAMELINELEPCPRGVYTGAIGLFMDNGGAHLNVAIRTAAIHNGIGRFHIGAGIVADSDPEKEWLETLSKGNMLSRWLQATS